MKASPHGCGSHHSFSRHRSIDAALLVFPAAAAGTRIVAPDGTKTIDDGRAQQCVIRHNIGRLIAVRSYFHLGFARFPVSLVSRRETIAGHFGDCVSELLVFTLAL